MKLKTIFEKKAIMNTNKKISLTKDNFSFVCPLKTEDMNVINGGYFCDECDKKVHDVTGMSVDEFNILRKTDDNICVAIQKVALVSLVLGVNACASPISDGKHLKGKIVSNSRSCDTNITEVKRENRLAPFKMIDKNETITVDILDESQLIGETMIIESDDSLDNNKSMSKKK